MRPAWAVWACALLLLVSGANPAAAQSEVEEDRLMAAFVQRFPQFVEWPAESMEDRDGVELCVAEPDPLGRELQRLVEGSGLEGQRLSVRVVSGPAGVDRCHLLFVSSLTDRPDLFLRAAEGRPILTVGESVSFLDQGGIINLRLVDRRLRFEVNMEAARRAGLRLSSQLLALAVDVRGTDGP